MYIKYSADEKPLLLLGFSRINRNPKRLTKVFVLAKRDQACLGKSSMDDSETTIPVTNGSVMSARVIEALAKCVKELLYKTVRTRLGARPAPDRMNT